MDAKALEGFAVRHKDIGRYMEALSRAGLMENTGESMQQASDAYRAARKREEEDAGKWIMSGGKSPRPLPIAENAVRWLKENGALDGEWRWNDFMGALQTRDPDGTWREPLDLDMNRVQKAVVNGFEEIATIRDGEIEKAVREIAAEMRTNPPKEYLLALAWDGVPRLATWLHVAFGTPADKLHADMGSNWLKGLAKRVLHPGCQFDEVLVIEGRQGLGKTRALRAIGGDWHVELTLSADDKDFYMSLAKNVVVEFSEGDILGATSTRKLKAIITKTKDQWRPPYERGMVTHPRGCVFAMTTNEDNYQRDATGGRRWLPVKAEKADHAWIEANRDQLLAEAVYRVEVLKETTHEYDTALAQAQEDRRDPGPMEEPILAWYASLPEERKEAGVRALEAFAEAFTVPGAADGSSWARPATFDMRTQMAISDVFKGALKLARKRSMKGGEQAWRWVKN